MGHVPRESLGSFSQVCAPVDCTSTGARLLEVQHVGRYRREKASQKPGQHIPEEVLHGDTLLSEDGPDDSFKLFCSLFQITRTNTHFTA